VNELIDRQKLKNKEFREKSIEILPFGLLLKMKIIQNFLCFVMPVNGLNFSGSPS